MNKIILFHLATGEAQYLKYILKNDPTFLFAPAESMGDLGRVRKRWNWADLLLLGCGLEDKPESYERTARFIDEIKLYWPAVKIVLVSTFKTLIEKIGRDFSDIVMAQINMSVKEGLNPDEIVQIFNECVTSEESPTFIKLLTKNVLIVDDEENILKTIGLLLKTLGRYNVWTAKEPGVAFNILEQNLDLIETIIVDYNLGTQTADKFIKAAKNINSRLKIYILSGEGKSQNPPWGSETEALIEGVLSKPFNIEEIVLAINARFKRQKPEAVHHHKPKVLVIDDIAETYQLLNDVLGSQLEIASVADGETGLIKFKEFKPDLVVIDYRLPGKNGLEVWREIQQMNPSQKALIVTIDRTPAVAEEFKKLGEPRILYKPVDPKDLDSAVREMVG